MEFSIFLSCYFPDTCQPAAAMYDLMLEEARLAEDLGYCGVTVPEHHFMNILMNPNPLMLAVKVADATKRIPITTSVLVLPFLDMKRLAGEIALADILTRGRIRLGVGRGAFRYEFDRFAVPVEKSREKFDESLAVLEALLGGEEVSWDGDYYGFAPLTVMPRPLQQPYPPIWIAAVTPTAVYHCARRGYDVQTTPLKASPEMVRELAGSFFSGAAEAGERGRDLRLSMLRAGFVAADAADAAEKVRLAHGYWRRFSNVRETNGDIRAGAITPIEIADSFEDIREAMLIGTAEQVVEKLRLYAEAGIHEVNLNMNIGATPRETLASMERFAKEVMPHFAAESRQVESV